MVRLLLILLLLPAGVAAQQPVVPLQFDFSDPGARSMAFGGAFVALADDATAAFANPAGLVQLVRPEVSIEGRHWNYSTPYTEGGRAEGLPSGFGLDDMVGLREVESTDRVNGLSFLSLAYPAGNWSLALYYHQLSNLDFFGETQGIFTGGSDCCQVREFDQRATSSFDVGSYGLSVAYRISERFNVGLGLTYHDASFDTETTIFGVDDDSLESIFGPNSYLPERSLLRLTSHSGDADWALSGGFLWHATDRWSIGGVYRQGPEIEITNELTAGQAGDFGVPPGGVLFRDSVPVEFPQIYGLGIAYRAPDGRLTVSFQWDRVEYSSIVESLGLDDQTADDIDELHLGAEYVFLDSTPILAVRLGTWLEPDHQLRATEDEPVLRALLPGGDDEVHVTAGLGVVMRRFQIDLAVDFADRADTVSLSVIHSF